MKCNYGHGWGDLMDGEMHFCKILHKTLLFLKQCASWAVTGSKIDMDPWNFNEFYFGMGLIFKDIESVLGSRDGFNM